MNKVSFAYWFQGIPEYNDTVDRVYFDASLFTFSKLISIVVKV